MSASVSPPESAAGGPDRGPAVTRPWLAAAGVASTVICLVPPVSTLAGRYVVAESVQFTVFAIVTPALLVLGAPWRLLRLSRADPRQGGAAAAGRGLLDRLAGGRRQQRSFLRAGVFLVLFLAVSLAWRLAPVMDALARQPGLVAAELLTLLVTGTALWAELVASPPLEPRLPRPQRAAVAALAMWATWAAAYIVGFHTGTVFSAYAAVPGRAIGLVADQEMAVAVIWGVAAAGFIPVVIVAMMSWLKDNDNPDEELQRLVRDGDQRAMVKGWGSPARGWGRSQRGGGGAAS